MECEMKYPPCPYYKPAKCNNLPKDRDCQGCPLNKGIGIKPIYKKENESMEKEE